MTKDGVARFSRELCDTHLDPMNRGCGFQPLLRTPCSRLMPLQLREVGMPLSKCRQVLMDKEALRRLLRLEKRFCSLVGASKHKGPTTLCPYRGVEGP